MTSLETLLVGSTAIVVILRVLGISSRPGARSFFSFLPAILLLFHFGIDGLRWQMIPAYLFALLWGAADVLLRSRHADPPPPGKWTRGALSALGIGWLAGSFLLPSSFPVSRWPDPNGEFSIGTRFLLLTDTSRIETFEPESGSFREIPTQAWYPAEPECGQRPENYWRNAGEMSAAWARANDMGWIPFIWNHLGRIQIHACEGAPISGEKEAYPVLVFSHGYWQVGSFNTALMEELASHGYVVLNITHPFETSLSVYPDGRIREFSRTNPEFRRRTEEADDMSRWIILEDIYQATTWEEQKPLLEEWYAGIPAWWESQTIWMEDILFAISELPGLNTSIFQGKLDLDRLGALGYSLGGTTSALAAMVDTRVKAGVNLDGFQYGHLMEHNLRIPFMFFSTEGHSGANDFFFERAEDTVYDLSIAGTRHSNFTDLPLLAGIPGRLTGHLGSIDPDRGSEILASYVVAFMDKHLKGVDSGLLDGSSPDFPEVTFRRRDPDR